MSQSGSEGEKGRNRTGEFEPCVVFVGNLDYKTSWQKLKDTFRQAGPVRFSDLIADANGRPKGSALVTFEDESGASNAIKMFHDTDFEGRRILVRKFEAGRRPPFVRGNMQPRDGPARGGMGNNAGGGGGGGMRQERGGGGRGGFNNNNNNNNAARGGARQQQPPHQGRGGDSRDVPRPRSQQNTIREDGKLFVSNLPFECTEQSLRDTFSQVGTVLAVKIIRGANGRSRGMGLVEFASRREAEIAIEEFDAVEMAGRPMQVRFERSNY